jgi:putative ABC transport system permease protein
MNSGEIVRTSIDEIRHHKMRSTLTLLGIILGTMSITVMTSLLDGIVAAVWQGFNDLGFDGVMYVTGREARDLRESSIFTRSKGLQPEDARFLAARGGSIAAASPVMFSDEVVRYGGEERKVRVTGATAAYAVVRNRAMETGRFFNESDEDSSTRVCVLGHRLRRRLFGEDDPTGRTLTLSGRSMRIVGVVQKLGNRFVNDDEFIEEMEGAYVPLSTLRKFYIGTNAPLAFLAVKTADPENLGDLKAQTIASLKIAHRGAQDFRINNIAEEILRVRKGITTLLRNWRIVLGTIAGISLLVGGIGLLSVMLISIGERLYEIGLRKAVGATDRQIFAQFLVESALLSLIGGLQGVAAGVAITKAVGGFFTGGLPIHPMGLVAALGIALVLGILYGVYPALKAARMEPVEALRAAS